MSKAQYREQVREAWDPPFQVVLSGAVFDNTKSTPRPVLTLDYGHATVQWQDFKDWVQTGPEIHYFYDEEGIGYYGVDGRGALRMAVFVRKNQPSYTLFKILVMKNNRLSIIAKTAKFGHFELTLYKKADLYQCAGGTIDGDLLDVDNTQESSATSEEKAGA